MILMGRRKNILTEQTMVRFVKMPEEDYLREHARLIRLLDASDQRNMKREANKQKREVVKYLLSRGLLK